MPDLPIYALEGVTRQVINTAIWQPSLGNLEYLPYTNTNIATFPSFLPFLLLS